MEKCEISKSTLGRIPYYVDYIASLPEDIQNISATRIAKELGFGEIQVRKDLAQICKNGKPKVGYDRLDLKTNLVNFLSNLNGRAIIVGAGQLGNALLHYDGFEIYGTQILAAFDSDEKKESLSPSGKSILPMDQMKDFCKKNNINIGIITTPSRAAQTVLNQLCECNIKRIWCFAPCRLYKPADVTVQYENLALSLAHLNLINK